MKSSVPVSVLATAGVAAIFTMSSAWTAGPQKQTMAASKTQNVVLEFTVPVRLSSVDRRIRSGQVVCSVIDLKTGDIVLGLGGMGIGRAYFSINSNDGNFSENVKVSIVPQKDVPDSQFAQELKYACNLSLSPDALPGARTTNNWRKPDANAKDGDMFQVKPGSPLVATVSGNIAAPK